MKPGKSISIINAGIKLLTKEKGYSYRSITKKLRYLGFEISPASLSNLINERRVSLFLLERTLEGLQVLVRKELGYEYNNEQEKFIKMTQGTAELITIPTISKETSELIEQAMKFHENGTVPIHEEVDFLRTAKSEIIYLGTTLSNPISYFFSRRETEYKTYVEDLLSRGVDITFYLLDPDSNEARLYFFDIKRYSFPFEDDNVSIKSNLEKLNTIKREFNNRKFKGKLKILTYKHLPSSYFLVVDGKSENGRLMTSPFLYGISSVNSPVVEVSKSKNLRLFNLYWRSLRSLIENAKEVVF